MQELVVNESESGQRLLRYLNRHLKEAPDSFLYKMLRKKNITLNGKRAAGSEKTAAGDIVCLYLSDDTIRKFSGVPSCESDGAVQKLPDNCDILYRSRDYLFVSKPAGILSQKAFRDDISLTELVRGYLRAEQNGSESAYPASPANRLDRNTSGIILFGLTARGTRTLTGMLADRSADKRYLAIVSGTTLTDGVYSVFYTKDSSRNRVILSDVKTESSEESGKMTTGFRVLCRGRSFSLIEAHLLTGRPHQIRAHLAYLGYPVAGDPKYGRRELNRTLSDRYGITRQMLHSWKITFPGTGEAPSELAGKVFEASLPGDMVNAMKLLELTL